MGKTIEIFTDSSRFPSDIIENQVKNYACLRCSFLVYDAVNSNTTFLMESKIAEYGIAKFPAVTIDGKVVSLDKLKKGKISTLVQKMLHQKPY
ncbi:hypothetical protein ACFSCX_00475 [Bacillus salitolerans]|uniref:Thioredoxin-like fold domain-containing protein n=1 Tax=Bacillus salitolerans TaxID=1437434 RepID=A0ABW4LKM7_9BACI